jgi:hypothetical protein
MHWGAHPTGLCGRARADANFVYLASDLCSTTLHSLVRLACSAGVILLRRRARHPPESVSGAGVHSAPIPGDCGLDTHGASIKSPAVLGGTRSLLGLPVWRGRSQWAGS